MKPSRFSPFKSSTLLPAFILCCGAPLLHAQLSFDLNGGNATLNGPAAYDGGDNVPAAPYFENSSQRDAFLVRGGGVATLDAGADISVLNDDFTAFLRIGLGTDGTLNILDGATLSVGQPSRYANVQIGQGAGSTGTVNQSGGTFSSIGSFNVGVNGGTGIYTISGGTFNFDHDGNAGTSFLTVGFNNAASDSGTSTGVFNIDGGNVNILPTDGGNTRFIIGNRVNTAIGGGASGSGNGILNQTAGTLSIGAGANLYLSGYGNGVYNLSGGTLEIGGTSLNARYASGATGTSEFNLSGGTIQVTGSDLVTAVDMTFVAGSTSTLDTNGLNATLTGSIDGGGSLVKSGLGQLNLEGNVSRSLGAFFAAEGTTDHRAGTTETTALLVGAYTPAATSGSMTLSGGTLNVTAPNSAVYIGAGGNSGSLDITGGILNLGVASDPSVRVEFYAGAFGATSTGTVNHSGGTVNKISDDGTFHIGNQATGIYNLSGTGEVNIYGPNSVVIGRSSSTIAGNGTLNISGGSFNFFEGADLSVGGAQASEPAGIGTGTVNQTGGLVAMGNGSIVLGQRGNGTYNLTGGILEIGGTNRLRQGEGGTASFNLGGGAIRIAGTSLTSSLDINVAPGNSFIDTNGLSADLSGDLTGSGTLVKLGAGSLNLTGDNALTGFFYIGEGNVGQSAGASDIRYLAVASGTGATGSYTLSGGSLDIASTLQIGDFGGNGTFIQQGGTLTVGSDTVGASMNIGNQGGSGVYNFSAGNFEIVNGFANLGRSNQATAGTGELNISGTAVFTIGTLGDLIVGDRDATGANGTGVVNQTGGIVRVEGNGELWVGAHGAGTYNLDGGRLEVGGTGLKQNYNSAGNSTFNLGGGTLAVTDTALTTDIRFNLSTGTSSTLDTGSLGATVNGFAGSGSLVKTGSAGLAIATDSTLGNLTVEEGSVTSAAAVTVGNLTLEANTTFSGSGFLQVTGTLVGTGSLGIDTRVTGIVAIGNSPGTLAVTSDFTVASGATYQFDLVGNAPGIAGITFDQMTLALGEFEMEDGSVFQIVFDGTDFTAAFWGEDQSWLVVDGDGTGAVTLGDVVLTGTENYAPYGNFALTGNGDDLSLSWTAVPEPSSAILLIAALVPLAGHRRRRND